MAILVQGNYIVPVHTKNSFDFIARVGEFVVHVVFSNFAPSPVALAPKFSPWWPACSSTSRLVVSQSLNWFTDGWFFYYWEGKFLSTVSLPRIWKNFVDGELGALTENVVTVE